MLLLLCLPAAASAQNNHVLIAEQNAPAVVAVNVAKNDGSTFTGTGFVVTPDGLIATSRHVAENALYINITFNNGAVSGEARTVAAAGNVDLALLKIQARDLPCVKLGNSDQVLPGQTITVIGNPRRLQNTISSGLISQVRKKADGVIWHQKARATKTSIFPYPPTILLSWPPPRATPSRPRPIPPPPPSMNPPKIHSWPIYKNRGKS